MDFLQDLFQMTAIAFVSVIIHYHISGLHLLMGCISFETPSILYINIVYRFIYLIDLYKKDLYILSYITEVLVIENLLRFLRLC